MAQIKHIISDLSRTVLFPKDSTYEGSLNALYREVKDRDDFNFWDYYELNNELLEQYKALKKTGISIYLFTTGTVQNDPAMEEAMEVFNTVFTEEGIGKLKKDNPESFKHICNTIKADPDTVLHIDDNPSFISTARTAGLKVLQYELGKQIDLERESKDWIGAVAIIKNSKGEYLLIQSNKNTGEYTGKYYPPSGTVEPGEEPIDAVVREVKEELNVDVRVKEEIMQLEGDLPGLTLVFFECEVIDESKFSMDDNELAGYYWLNTGEMKDIDMYPATKRFFNRYLGTDF